MEDGYCDSTDSWAAVMRDLKARGRERASPRGRRRRTWQLGCAPRRVTGRQTSGMLGARDPECARLPAQAAAAQGETDPARDYRSGVAERRVVVPTTVASKLVGLFPQIDEKESPRWPKVRG